MAVGISPNAVIIVLLSLLGSSANAQGFTNSVAAWLTRTQTAVSGLAVQTKQMSVSSQQVSSATQSSFKALANTIVTTNANFDYMRNLQSSTASLTSGGELCRVADVGNATVQAHDVADVVRSGVADYERNWKANGGDQNDIFLTQLEMRQQVYCSEAEFQAGLCSENPGSHTSSSSAGFPAGDTNAAPFMLSRSYGSTEASDGLNYIDAVAPLPTVHSVSRGVGDDISNLFAIQELAWSSVVRGAIADVIARGTEGGN